MDSSSRQSCSRSKVQLQVQIVAEEKTVRKGDGYGMQVTTRIAVWWVWSRSSVSD